MINVAICGPLSGIRKAYGELLIEETYYLKERDDINIEYFDDKADPDQAVKIANEIVSKKFDFVLGHFNSFCSIASKDIYQNAKISFISPLSTNSNLNFSIGGALFSPADNEQLMLFKSLKENGKKILSISDGSRYSSGLNLMFSEYIDQVVYTKDLINLNMEIDESDVIIFLSGIHSNLIDSHIYLRKKYKCIEILCCDDCSIDEYYFSLKKYVNDLDYIISQEGGHVNVLKKSIKYLNYLIDYFSPEDYFYIIGKSIENYEFHDNGRINNAKWGIYKLQNFILG